MSHDGRAIANLVLDEAQKMGIEISNLTLQKILFFCHAWHMVDTDEPLIKHEFEAWQHGPVLQYVYRQFRACEDRAISQRATKLDPHTGKQIEVRADFKSDTVERIRGVIKFYGKMAPWDLVDLSHVNGGPWDEVFNNSSRINPGMKISHDAVKEYYSRAVEGRPIQ